MIIAAEQSAENLGPAFFLIQLIMVVSFLAGYGLCFMRMHKRNDD